MFKILLNFPVYRRLILKNYFKRIKKDKNPDVDRTIEEFLSTTYEYGSEEDKNFVIYTLADAFQAGIYSGDITKLSARTCSPFSEMFKKRFEVPEKKNLKNINIGTPKTLDFFGRAVKKGSSAISFLYGMDTLPKGLYSYLYMYENFKHIKENVISIKENNSLPVIQTNNENIEVDYVISTIPSGELGKVLVDKPEIKKICDSIPHNSLQAINLGFDNLNLEGIGYLIPRKENCALSGVLYDSASFPHLRPCVSLMGDVNASPDELISIFKKQTGVTQDPVIVNVSKYYNGLPQYNKGHYKLVKEIQSLSPTWLSISGQSFGLSGIPNCVRTSLYLVEDLIKKKTLKSFLHF